MENKSVKMSIPGCLCSRSVYELRINNVGEETKTNVRTHSAMSQSEY